jgi:hypothetical protein
MDNLQTIWAAVDLHRAIANDLEMHARLLGGDRPSQEFVEIDKIQAYKDVIEALEGAKDTLQKVVEQEGKPREPRKFASRCHVHSRRCAAVLEELLKVGEL